MYKQGLQFKFEYEKVQFMKTNHHKQKTKPLAMPMFLFGEQSVLSLLVIILLVIITSYTGMP